MMVDVDHQTYVPIIIKFNGNGTGYILTINIECYSSGCLLFDGFLFS